MYNFGAENHLGAGEVPALEYNNTYLEVLMWGVDRYSLPLQLRKAHPIPHIHTYTRARANTCTHKMYTHMCTHRHNTHTIHTHAHSRGWTCDWHTHSGSFGEEECTHFL